MYVCMYVCMLVFMCMHVCTCVCMYVCICLSIFNQSIRLPIWSVQYNQDPPTSLIFLPCRLSNHIFPVVYSPQPSHCTDRAVPPSGTFVNVMLRLCEFQRKCQARIRSVCHLRAVRCQQPHINRGVIGNTESWLWVVTKSVRRITMYRMSLVSIVTAAVFSQTLQVVLNFVLRIHYTRPENKMCLILHYLLTYSMQQSPSWEANWSCS